jgi:hypothetical protein
MLVDEKNMCNEGGNHPMAHSITSLDFAFRGARQLRARFDAAPISSDGGAPLLAALDRQLGLVDGLASAVRDPRDGRYTDHSFADMLRQRIFQIALGYEDCNDADTLRHDPVLKASCGRDPVQDPDLASQPTLSRFENALGPKACYRLAKRLFAAYLMQHSTRPREVVLDLDLTDDPTHGQQELSFFHGFYDSHVYLPLLVFDQDGALMTAVLLPGRNPGAGPAVAVLKRLVKSLRERWPDIRLLVRADAGFASPALYQLVEDEGLECLIGFRSNPRLERMARRLQARARRRFLRTGLKARLFTSVRYRARKGWPKRYRIVIKAEHMKEGPNVRFVLTTLSGRSDDLYDRYVERGEACENSIKDLKRALKGDRLSCHRFWANQVRLLLHAAAYVLLFALRRCARGTELAEVQFDTLRLRLLKVGASLVGSVRRLTLHLSASHPWQRLWWTVARRVLRLATVT